MELITRTLLDGAGRLAVQFSRRFKPIFLAQVMESVLNFIDPSISKDIFGVKCRLYPSFHYFDENVACRKKEGRKIDSRA